MNVSDWIAELDVARATIERLVAAGDGLVAFAAGALANDEGLALVAAWEKAKEGGTE